MSFGQLTFNQRVHTPHLTVYVNDLGFDLRQQMLQCQFLLHEVFTFDLFHKHYVLRREIQLMSLCDTHGLREVLHDFIRFVEYYRLEAADVSELDLLSLPLIDEELVAAGE